MSDGPGPTETGTFEASPEQLKAEAMLLSVCGGLCGMGISVEDIRRATEYIADLPDQFWEILDKQAKEATSQRTPQHIRLLPNPEPKE